MALDLDRFRRELAARREALIAEDELAESARAPVTLDKESVGRLSRIDAMQMQAMALAQQRRRQDALNAIEAAFRRMDAGDFGYCVKCGEEIVPARLEHNPAAATCNGCAT